MKTLLGIDFDKHACAAYCANFPGVEVVCGKVEDHIESLPYADLVTGGPPCVGFSRAGKGAGEFDPRDGWPAAIKAVEKVRPRAFLFENSDAMLDAKHLTYTRRIVREFAEANYTVETGVLNSVSFGVPQFRKRLWIWGIRNDLYGNGIRHMWPKPTHTWPYPNMGGLFGDGYKLKCAVTVGMALGLMGNSSIFHAPCPTLVGGSTLSHTNGRSCISDKMWRRKWLSVMGRNLTAWDCQVLMSAPGDYVWPREISRTTKYRILCNGQTSILTHALMQAMLAVDKELKTHISLFCGGGIGDCGLHGRYWEFEADKAKRRTA